MRIVVDLEDFWTETDSFAEEIREWIIAEAKKKIKKDPRFKAAVDGMIELALDNPKEVKGE